MADRLATDQYPFERVQARFEQAGLQQQLQLQGGAIERVDALVRQKCQEGLCIEPNRRTNDGHAMTRQ
ncbi:hypothetical protein D3C87_1194210 [compost metagenome]